jgi:tetratricopeptide (TPR) repeat protein
LGVSGVLILRIKRAEVALRDGRLDEACRIASDSEVQAHRRGQALIGKLVRALARRGQAHLEAGRYPQASADCEKAGEIGGNVDVVAELRQALAERFRQDHAVKDRHEAGLAEAKQRIANGQLTLGGQRLAGMEHDSLRTHRLAEDVEARRALAASAVDRARQAVERHDWHAAIGALREARDAHPRHGELERLIGQVNTQVGRRVREQLAGGRPDLARTLLASWRVLSADHPDVTELSHVLDELRRAQALLAGGGVKDWAEARATLQRVAHACPQAAWIREMVAHLDAGLQAHSQVQSSPLGLLAGADGDPTLPVAHQPQFAARVMTNDQHDSPPIAHASSGQMPSRFLLHVDGSGSFLVVRESRVTVGPGGTSGRHDVSLLADSGLPYGTIERHEDDYFLLSDGSVKLNGQGTTRSLLNHGDKVALSARCGFTFVRPNAASGTALLQLSGTRLNHSDTRRVILLQREIVLGAGPSAHVRVSGLSRNIVLYVQHGALYCKSAEAVLCDGRAMDRREGIPLERNVQIGDVTMVVKAV